MIDPYLIPNTNTLKNKLGITDSTKLNKAEMTTSLLNLSTAKELVKGDFNYKHLMDLHKHIFGDVYDWAGQPRTINMEKPEKVLTFKSVEYGDHNTIQRDIKNMISDFKGTDWKSLSSYDEKSQEFSKHLAKLWQIHPFREGNTRTVTEFCMQFAETKGIYFDREVIAKNTDFFRNALVVSSIGEYSDPKHLRRIIKDSMQKGDILRKKDQSKNKFSLDKLKEIDSNIKSEKTHKKNHKKIRETEL